jgi:hypothetical protein
MPDPAEYLIITILADAEKKRNDRRCRMITVTDQAMERIKELYGDAMPSAFRISVRYG